MRRALKCAAALGALAVLGACGVDGPPRPPEPNSLPQDRGFDVSPVAADGISGEAPYGMTL